MFRHIFIPDLWNTCFFFLFRSRWTSVLAFLLLRSFFGASSRTCGYRGTNASTDTRGTAGIEMGETNGDILHVPQRWKMGIKKVTLCFGMQRMRFFRPRNIGITISFLTYCVWILLLIFCYSQVVGALKLRGRDFVFAVLRNACVGLVLLWQHDSFLKCL